MRNKALEGYLGKLVYQGIECSSQLTPNQLQNTLELYWMEASKDFQNDIITNFDLDLAQYLTPFIINPHNPEAINSLEDFRDALYQYLANSEFVKKQLNEIIDSIRIDLEENNQRGDDYDY